MATGETSGSENRNDGIVVNNDPKKEDKQNKENMEPQVADGKIQSVSVKDYNIENRDVFYNIIVRTSQNTWVSKKRYHQFDELHSQLSDISQRKLPLLPAKHSKLFTDHTDIDFIEQRRALLDNYTKKLLKLKDATQNKLIINFLNEGNSNRVVSQNDNENRRLDGTKKDPTPNENDSKQEPGNDDNRKMSDSYQFPSDQEVTHINIQQVRKMSDHVLYQISVMNNRKRSSFRKWVQLKRFTQFYEMDCKLRESLANTSFNIDSLPSTPSRRFKLIHDHMDDDFIEERRVLLENYLLRLLRIPEVAKNEHFLEFLG